MAEKRMKESLSKEEFNEWKDNHFDHLCIDVAGIKKDVGWVKWLICGATAAVGIRLVLQFFGI